MSFVPDKAAAEKVADEIVNGFFIGGGGDSLESPNLTKFDLRLQLVHSLERAQETGATAADQRLLPLLDSAAERLKRLVSAEKVVEAVKYVHCYSEGPPTCDHEQAGVKCRLCESVREYEKAKGT